MRSGGEFVRFITSSGRLLDGDTALHAMVDLWCRTDYTRLPVAVPLVASIAVETIAAATGHDVVRPGRSMRSMAELALRHKIGFAGSTTGGYLFADFLASYDAVMTLGSVARMLGTVGQSLDDVVDALPEFHKRHASIFCPIDRKGAVMRVVTQASDGLQVELAEGVRIVFDDAWVLVLPHASDPLVNVWVEADTGEAAETLLTQWQGVVEGAIEID